MANEIGNSALIRTWASGGAVQTPANAKVDEGWLGGEQPPHEWMNWLHNTFGQKINHSLSRGVSNWIASTTYTLGAVVNRTGSVWVATAENVNSEPSDANTNWARLIVNGSAIVGANGTEGDPGISFRSGAAAAGFFSPAAATLAVTTGDVERGRVTAAGALFWGQTGEASPGIGNSVYGASLRANGTLHLSREDSNSLTLNRSNNGAVASFHRAGNGTSVGSIVVAAGSTSYITTSDGRLKKNVTPAGDPWAVLSAFAIVEYDWEFGGHVRWGAIAQDVHAVMPEIVHVGDNSNQVINPWGIEASPLELMMVKALQDLHARVIELESRLAETEAN
jgi:hypothetical protein